MLIRFDGVYVSKQPVDFGMPEREQPYSYLRFYNDGTVIQSDIPGIRPAATIDSFDKVECANRGHYQIHGHTLSCVFPVSAKSSATGKASTIEERGEIVGDELHLHHVSYINNFSYDEQYKFYAWPEERVT